MGKILLEAKSVYKKFDDKNVLEDINLCINNEQFIVILGHSGSGKSTMINILSSILSPTTGQVLYNGQDITKLSKKQIADIRREEIGFVFQHYMLLPNLTIRENIILGNKKNNENMELENLCTFLGIQHLLENYPYQLSGGEQQRACIARAVIKKPSVLFCDEATGALDKDNSINIITLLHDVRKKFGTTILFTTHNREIAKTADRVLVLEDGHIIKDYINTHILSSKEMKWGI